MTFLTVENLNLSLVQKHQRVSVLKDISFDILQGETLGIVGESGSGKSMLMRSLLGILPQGSSLSFDRFYFNGQEINQKNALNQRPHMAMILQDPKAALNPVMTVESQLQEAFILKGERKNLHEKCLKALYDVSIQKGEEVLKHYPFELSNIMSQRVMIAMMLALKPKLLIADDLTSSLDLPFQAEALNLLKDLQERYGFTMILVTRDLGMAHLICDDVFMMHQGERVDHSHRKILHARKVQFPYTKELVDLSF